VRTSRNSGARSEQPPYRCFLVRCWLEEGAGPQGEPVWRFTVQQTGPDAARRSFSCLHGVAAHMEAELAACGRCAATVTGKEGEAGKAD
jgi:hypothetical protein